MSLANFNSPTLYGVTDINADDVRCTNLDAQNVSFQDLSVQNLIAINGNIVDLTNVDLDTAHLNLTQPPVLNVANPNALVWNSGTGDVEYNNSLLPSSLLVSNNIWTGTNDFTNTVTTAVTNVGLLNITNPPLNTTTINALTREVSGSITTNPNLVDLNSVQTLTNKTFTSPSFDSPSILNGTVLMGAMSAPRLYTYTLSLQTTANASFDVFEFTPPNTLNKQSIICNVEACFYNQVTDETAYIKRTYTYAYVPATSMTIAYTDLSIIDRPVATNYLVQTNGFTGPDQIRIFAQPNNADATDILLNFSFLCRV